MTDPLSPKLATVFGGSGFIGKHVIRALVRDGWRVRVPMRRPHLGLDLKVIGNVGQVQLMQSNLRFPDSVARALEGADAVVNLVAILYEQGPQTFEAVHVEGAQTLAKAAAAQDIAHVAHISAIGADPESESHYARTKGEAEAILRAAVPTADILRPSIVFGSEDEFFNRFAGMAGLAPALPLIGGGKTRFQPVWAGDVAEAVARVLGQGTTGETYELGGPRVYTFRELMEFMLAIIDKRRLLVPVPFGAAGLLGKIGQSLGRLPLVPTLITEDQVTLLESDNVVTGEFPGFKDLGITPSTVEAVVPDYLIRYRKFGQFHVRSDGELVVVGDD